MQYNHSVDDEIKHLDSCSIITATKQLIAQKYYKINGFTYIYYNLNQTIG